MEKKVSIIMGIYNCEKTISDTIDSILNQTYPNWELVMCDDASTDRTYQIALMYQEKDKRINLISNKTNQGLAQTLNNCLKHSSGDFILRHDGDDLMVAERIEKQVNYMESNDCDACGSGAYLFNEAGVWGIRQPEKNPKSTIMIVSAPFIHPTVIMKQSALSLVGGYSVNKITQQRLEDYDLWLKFFERDFKLENIQEPLIYFREDQNSYKRKSRKFRIAETAARLDACRRLKIPYFKRVFALKPIIVFLIPKKLLRFYHVKKARQLSS